MDNDTINNLHTQILNNRENAEEIDRILTEILNNE